tara:strand:- start:1771 stop:2064 length:294 start_codon:yes stop_codon:yes gene_type:complete
LEPIAERLTTPWTPIALRISRVNAIMMVLLWLLLTSFTVERILNCMALGVSPDVLCPVSGADFPDTFRKLIGGDLLQGIVCPLILKDLMGFYFSSLR